MQSLVNHNILLFFAYHKVVIWQTCDNLTKIKDFHALSIFVDFEIRNLKDS